MGVRVCGRMGVRVCGRMGVRVWLSASTRTEESARRGDGEAVDEPGEWGREERGEASRLLASLPEAKLAWGQGQGQG